MEKNSKLILAKYIKFLQSLISLISIILLIDAIAIVFSQKVSFCVIEWLIAILFIFEIALIVRLGIKYFLKFNLALIFAIFVVLNFTTLPYYSINTFTEQSGLEVVNSSKEELKSLCIDLIDKTNNSYVNNEDSFESIAIKSKESFNKLNTIYPFIKTLKTIPKPVFHSRVMSRWNVTGFFSAFTLESIINKDITPVELPFTMCHELSHISNFLKEDESNYIAYLACKNSDDSFFNYSGYYNAMIYATNAYYCIDPNGYFEIMSNLSDDVCLNIYNQSLFWSKYEDTKSSKTYDKIDDAFLKYNNVFDGTQSYGRMVDLLLAEYRLENGGTNSGN